MEALEDYNVVSSIYIDDNCQVGETYGDKTIYVDYDFFNQNYCNTATFRLPISLRECYIRCADYRKLSRLSSYDCDIYKKLSNYNDRPNLFTLKDRADLLLGSNYTLSDIYDEYLDNLDYWCFADIKDNGEEGMLSHVSEYIRGM